MLGGGVEVLMSWEGTRMLVCGSLGGWVVRKAMSFARCVAEVRWDLIAEFARDWVLWLLRGGFDKLGMVVERHTLYGRSCLV